ncbi:DUF4133 domain-containing protein [Fluviicola sp.]|uniref:DUF4133 domain-containing protein n=1 Tax=Fluviicola sp. TaxID=1917219 RepID=UPI0031D03A12
MATSNYQINKGINKSIEFKGLKAQYIWYVGIGFVGVLILFSLLYFIGIPSIVCVLIAAVLGGGVVAKVYSMSNKYGEYGLMKALARKQVPNVIKINDRKLFQSITKTGKRS